MTLHEAQCVLAVVDALNETRPYSRTDSQGVYARTTVSIHDCSGDYQLYVHDNAWSTMERIADVSKAMIMLKNMI
jgi:hypothetical protein